jgi:hypothetical protein
MQVVNTVLLSFIVVTTSLTCLFILMLTRRNNKDRLRLLMDSKLETIKSLAQDFNTSCTQVLEVDNALRAKLGRIERMGRKGADNGDLERRNLSNSSEAGKQQLQEEILAAQSLAEKLWHLYIECYLSASDQLLHQSSEVASIRDCDLSKLFNELVLLQSRVEETWQNLDKMSPVEKARVLLGHFSRMSNYLYLLRETSQRVTDRTICLKNQD